MSTNNLPQIEGNCLITNYKPTYSDEENYKERQHNVNDINIFVNNGQVEEVGALTRENIQKSDIDFVTVFKAIASLGGDKDKVEAVDINSIDKLIGIHKIKQVAKDFKNGVARLIFDNGEQLRIDFETEEEAENPDYSEEYRLNNVKYNEAAIAKVESLKNNEKICKYFDIKMEMDAKGNLTGRVAITMKKSVDTDQIRTKLNLSEGAILDSNKELLEQKYNEQKANRFFTPSGPQYDYLTLEAGETIYLPNYRFD